MLNENDYCKCAHPSSITATVDEWGYWDTCCDCNKPLEDGFHDYNHYDGKDHDNSDLY
jgi:hypothetical protein